MKNIRDTFEDLDQQAREAQSAYDHAMAMLNLSLCALFALLITVLAVILFV